MSLLAEEVQMQQKSVRVRGTFLTAVMIGDKRYQAHRTFAVATPSVATREHTQQ